MRPSTSFHGSGFAPITSLGFVAPSATTSTTPLGTRVVVVVVAPTATTASTATAPSCRRRGPRHDCRIDWILLTGTWLELLRGKLGLVTVRSIPRDREKRIGRFGAFGRQSDERKDRVVVESSRLESRTKGRIVTLTNKNAVLSVRGRCSTTLSLKTVSRVGVLGRWADWGRSWS